MITKKTLLDLCDQFRDATGVAEEKTLSYRIFRDSKRLRNLRDDGDITLGSYTDAMMYLARHWPESFAVPSDLAAYVTAVGGASVEGGAA